MMAATVLGVVVTSLSAAFYYGQDSARVAGERVRAVALAEESLEAARNIRDQNPNDPFVNLPGGTHGLTTAGNQWSLSGNQDTVGIFDRQLVISTIDANTLQLTANVSWDQTLQRPNQTVSLTTYLTNWLAEKASAFGEWNTGVFKTACLDVGGTADGRKVKAAGNYAYLIRAGGTPNFVVADISGPSPVMVGSLTLNGIASSLAVSGSYVYIASQVNGQELQVVDISNPTAPSLAGSYNAAGAQNALGVYAVGQTVYLTRAAGSGEDFLVIDASNPASPNLLGSVGLSADAFDVYVTGNYAFAASSDDAQELLAIDVSVPSAMTIDDAVDLGGVADALTISGFNNTVAVGRSDGQFHLIDVTNPLNMSVVSGPFDEGAQINDLSRTANSDANIFAATSETAGELQVYDISNQATPALFGSYNDGANNVFYGVSYDPIRDKAIVASSDNVGELCIFSPYLGGSWGTPILAGSLNVRNEAGSPNFVVVDITDKNNPSLAGQLTLGGLPQNIALSGNYAYVASSSGSQELQIVNIANPLLPVLAGSYNAPGTRSGLGVDVVGTTVYLTRDASNSTDELIVVDASNPAAPAELGALNLGLDANEVKILGNYAYIATDINTQELVVVNISNPASLAVNANLNLIGANNAETVTGANNLVFVGRDQGLMHVVDVANPLSPAEIAVYSAQAAVRDITVGLTNNFIYIGSDFNGMELQIVDISSPAAPTLFGSYNTSPDSDLNGVAYDPLQDLAVAVGEDDAAEVIIVSP